MASRIGAVTTDCADPRRPAALWRAALGFETEEEGDDRVLFRNPDGDPWLGFQPVPEGKVAKNRVHLDLLPIDGEWRDEAAGLEGPGAALVRNIDERPDEAHWLMRDPEGNEFCCVWQRPVPERTGRPGRRAGARPRRPPRAPPFAVIPTKGESLHREDR